MNGLIKEMAIEFGIPPKRLYQVIRTAPLRYKVFFIKKKTGGLRQVAQPAREVKAIQRWLMTKFSTILPLHEAATAYVRGSSIKANANLHSSNAYLLKMDFKNFFPSILAVDLNSHLQLHSGHIYTEEDIAIAVRACTWAYQRALPLRLCIGAPSSPMLSNSIMYAFDEEVFQHSLREGVRYTRYADDLTFSCASPDVLKTYPDFIEGVLARLDYPRITVNKQKTVHASRAGNRTVTGLVLTPEGKVSIGRERKRLIRSMYHRYKLGQLPPGDFARLFGLINFAEDIEPGFRARLEGTADSRNLT
jgi:retron-type reverse transcriptase